MGKAVIIHPFCCGCLKDDINLIDLTCPELKTPFKCYVYEQNKILGDCVCDKIEVIEPFTRIITTTDADRGPILYTWHFSNTNFYDVPKDLGIFKNCNKIENEIESSQRWLYVEE